MAKQPKSQKDFLVGTFVGMAQTMVGVALATRLGPVAGFMASMVIYIVCYHAYRWLDEQ